MTTEIDAEGLAWPERLTLRDTKVYADEGQRIFTTATGHGYARQEYIRADLAATRTSEAEPVAWRNRVWNTDRERWGGWVIETEPQSPKYPHLRMEEQPLYTLPTPASDDQVEAVTDEMVNLFHEVYTSKVREYDRDFRDYTRPPSFWREKYGTHLHATSLGEKWAIRAALAAMGSTKPAPRLDATVRSGEEG